LPFLRPLFWQGDLALVEINLGPPEADFLPALAGQQQQPDDLVVIAVAGRDLPDCRQLRHAEHALATTITAFALDADARIMFDHLMLNQPRAKGGERGLHPIGGDRTAMLGNPGDLADHDIAAEVTDWHLVKP
jgi:hypothetical protein